MKLQPAMVFGSHMVLQRRQPIPVWGRAAAGDTVTVTLGADSVSAAVQDGRWQTELPAREAETGLCMTICSAKTGECITLCDVAVGEVWLAGGQSNMEFLFRYDIEAPSIIPEANDLLLRCFDYPEASSAVQLQLGRFEDYGFWRSWNPDDAPWFSAVGYWFAAQLRRVLDVPVGILACNWGGTVAAAWTSRATLESDPALQPVLDSYDAEKARLDWEQYFSLHLQQAVTDPAITRAVNDVLLMGGDLTELLKRFAPLDNDGNTVPAPPPEMPGPLSPNAPGALYDNMVTQVAPYGIRGIIWYQGESDDAPDRAHLYDHSLRALRSDWCRLWDRELPLLQVMLAPFDHWLAVQAMAYPTLREKQKLLADTIPGFYVANIMDHGDADNIHPREKRWAGERLSRLARKYIYGETLLADSPSMYAVDWSEGCAVVRFTHAAGLHLTGEHIDALELWKDGAAVPFSAHLEGETMVVRSDAITAGARLELRYAWQNYCIVNCHNAAGLPVFPFRAGN